MSTAAESLTVQNLQDQLLIAHNKIDALRTALAATQQLVADLKDRLTLRPEERKACEGHDDGCARVGELRPMLVRCFGLKRKQVTK